MNMTEIAGMHLFGIVLTVLFFSKAYQIVSRDDEAVLEFLMWLSFGFLTLLYVILDLSIGVVTVNNAEGRLLIFGLEINAVDFSAITTAVLCILIPWLVFKLIENKKEIDKLNQELALLRYDTERTQVDNPDE